jgi:hypothetical protein
VNVIALFNTLSPQLSMSRGVTGINSVCPAQKGDVFADQQSWHRDVGPFVSAVLCLSQLQTVRKFGAVFDWPAKTRDRDNPDCRR